MKLHSKDTVLVVCQPVLPGDEEEIDGQRVHFDKTLGYGHKIAARSIKKGEKVIKFGISIGSATRDIGLGEHVHLHNMKSDYLYTYTLDDEFTEKK